MSLICNVFNGFPHSTFLIHACLALNLCRFRTCNVAKNWHCSVENNLYKCFERHAGIFSFRSLPEHPDSRTRVRGRRQKSKRHDWSSTTPGQAAGPGWSDALRKIQDGWTVQSSDAIFSGKCNSVAAIGSGDISMRRATAMAPGKGLQVGGTPGAA
ncbi:MAG: hypothetical protein WAO21_10140 [Verrucomicrobiia bacterium]